MMRSVPEAAEVELVRRRLDPLLGLRITGKRALDLRRVTVADTVLRQNVVGTRRIGKRLGLVLQNGDYLVCHLGMTGDLTVSDSAGVANTEHLRAVIYFDQLALVFADRRRFGYLRQVPRHEFEAGLGVDLLHSTGAQLVAAARKSGTRRTTVKAVMLDQANPIAGAGNYLVDEACFAERVHPGVAAHALAPQRWVALWSSCRRVALRSLAGRAPRMADFIAPDGAVGNWPNYLHCYGRAGRRCLRCENILVRTVVAQRGTTFCPVCQPLEVGSR